MILNFFFKGNLCVSKINCRECIITDNDCGWCKMATLLDKSKCDHIDNIRAYCPKEHIVYPENKYRIDIVIMIERKLTFSRIKWHLFFTF